MTLLIKNKCQNKMMYKEQILQIFTLIDFQN
jgi:hypothetical protein